MPELPDIVVYIESLERRIAGDTLKAIRIANPFVLRSVEPGIEEAAGRRVRRISRIGKRIAIGLDGGVSIVIHLMISGRLKWLAPGAKIPARLGLAAMDFTAGTLLLTEASKKKRASLRLVLGDDALRALDPGGIDPLDADPEAFRAALTRENHTRQARPDRSSALERNRQCLFRRDPPPRPHLARPAHRADARRGNRAPPDRLPRSPDRVDGAFAEGSRRPLSRRRSRPSARRWPCTAATANPVPIAERPCSGSCMPTTRRTTAPDARRAAGFWPIAPYRGFSRAIGRGASRIWTKKAVRARTSGKSREAEAAPARRIGPARASTGSRYSAWNEPIEASIALTKFG